MIGIDSIIDDTKTVFTSELFLTPLVYTSYGRAFVNERDGVKIPEVLSSGNEYAEVKLNSNLDAMSFFVVGNDYKITNDVATGTVTVYFAVNLRTCYASVTERAVEYVHRDVALILRHQEFDLSGIMNGWGEFENDFQNMQPFYLVRFTCNCQWILDQC